MSKLFYYLKYPSNFNGDVSSWDTSSVTDMSYMFYHYTPNFNGDVSSWDTSSVTDMSHMFRVRPLRACPSPPSLHSRALSPCMALVRCRRPTLSRLPQPTPRSASYALLSTRQGASAFNQALSFDTSSVTDMNYMFNDAKAFNQPLSFDTSSVTDMGYMFYVRSAHAL